MSAQNPKKEINDPPDDNLEEDSQGNSFQDDKKLSKNDRQPPVPQKRTKTPFHDILSKFNRLGVKYETASPKILRKKSINTKNTSEEEESSNAVGDQDIDESTGEIEGSLQPDKDSKEDRAVPIFKSTRDKLAGEEIKKIPKATSSPQYSGKKNARSESGYSNRSISEDEESFYSAGDQDTEENTGKNTASLQTHEDLNEGQTVPILKSTRDKLSREKIEKAQKASSSPKYSGNKNARGDSINSNQSNSEDEESFYAIGDQDTEETREEEIADTVQNFEDSVQNRTVPILKSTSNKLYQKMVERTPKDAQNTSSSLQYLGNKNVRSNSSNPNFISDEEESFYIVGDQETEETRREIDGTLYIHEDSGEHRTFPISKITSDKLSHKKIDKMQKASCSPQYSENKNAVSAFRDGDDIQSSSSSKNAIKDRRTPTSVNATGSSTFYKRKAPVVPSKPSVRSKPNVPNRSKACNIHESVSSDGNEYIRKVQDGNGFVYLSQLLLRNTNPPYRLNIGTLGDECLLVANNDRFIARIEILANIELSQTFEKNKQALLKNISITEILKDELIFRKNAAYSNFIQTLERRSANISNSVECAEDFLQLLLITKSYRLALSKTLMFLREILQRKNISPVIKNAAEHFEKVENKLYFRSEYFPKFSNDSNPLTKNLFDIVRDICDVGISNHKQNLIKSCPTKNSYLLCHILSVADLPNDKILLVNRKDIELFSNAVTVAHEESSFANRIIPLDFVKYLWEKFYSKVLSLTPKSVKEVGPLTHPVYSFLLKNFRDIVLEIASKADIKPQKLLKEENGYFRIKKSISWPSKSAVHNSLENQYKLYYKLLNHFEPGSYSNKNIFKYSFLLLEGNYSLMQSIKDFLFGREGSFQDIPEDRLVWLYVVDSGTAPLLCDDSSNKFKELSLYVLKGFIRFLEEAKQDRYESFRIAALNIIKFMMQLSPYFNDVSSILTDVDHNILDKQMDFINIILDSDDTDELSDYFSSLMDIYNEYWQLRENILENLPIPCSIFRDDMEVIQEKILKLVETGLTKCSETKLVIRFFRFYNEFLKHIKGIDFSWLISKACYSDFLSRVVESIVKKDVTSYIVKDSEQFVQILKKKNMRIPQHFLIETVKELLDIIHMVFEKGYWCDEDCLNAVGDLFLAIGHSFTHFEDQADYNDLEHFLRDCTAPFHSVVTNSDTYEDFKKRLDNVENFFLYARKQNQIGIKRALELCELEVKEASEKGFNTSINKSILETCYNLYAEKLGSLENLDIPEVLDEMEKDIEEHEFLPLEQWTPSFKQNVVPVLLAGLASVWTILESKDIANIQKRIEPHCVQILCILRLLGVDNQEKGVPKHFSQVLTGQGKSVIFGLLSAVIALSGHKANVVCYSTYLAQRDKMAFSNFFEQFSRFNIKGKIDYQTFNNIVFDSLNMKIDNTEKSINSLINDLVLNKLHPKSIEFYENRLTSVLLIDEADVFFSDNFYGQTYNPCINIDIPALLEIQPKLWEIVEGGLYEKNTIMEKIRDFITELLKDETYKDFKDFISTTNSLFEQHLDKMVSNAITVSKKKNESHWFIERFKLDFDGFISFRNSLGIYTTNTFNQYYNMFNYFRLKKENFDHKAYSNYGYIILGYGSISYANIPLRYNNILGVSGTLMTLDESEKTAMKNYGIKAMSAMPSFFGERKLVFNPTEHFSIQDSESNWHSKIFDHILENITLNRAVLVFFDTDIEVKAFEEKYRGNINRLYVLIGNEESSAMEWRINEAGVAQTVTLASRAMGRGIDYKSNDRSVEENGGVHVIQTFFSLDEKEETQIKGRTARKDNKGSYEMVVCREHLKEIGVSQTSSGDPISTYEQICLARNEKAKAREEEVATNIKNSEEKHNLTFKFFESLVNYTPEKRLEVLSQYPFVEDK